jgi:DnaJ-class molecular chaperone
MNKTFEFTYSSKRTGFEYTIKVPGKFVVCEECQGSGRVLRDGLRGHAFSSEELFEDEGFAEGYLRGDYDVKCDVCHGERLVLEPDESRMSKRQLFLWKITFERMADDMAEARHYRMLRNAGIEY